ncbi:MAG: DNA repair protein RadA [Candidatus Euphemobacter frigidus]|nr:DNA repair protein RadA [Candidatus Euphemobacter frigidus]MDP8275660.1 DNA repair protein RadA [Candidatus Euphemobacter frigidus]
MKTAFFCQECGYKSLKWMGKCPSCGAWNSLVEETVEVTKPGLSHPRWEKNKPRPITEIKPRADIRTRTGIREFDRILGGGIVAGSLILVGGEPGIGKSTLLLQVSNALSVSEKTVLYVSGEESVEQSKLRAERLGASSPGLFLVSETNLDLILEYIREVQPALVIIDSIQTIFKPEITSAPGSISQVRECAARLLVTAKSEGFAIFLIGHVTKTGAIAGPRVLEHMVDTVLYFEGDRHHVYRILRAVKNRFGSTDEIGIFQMSERGLKEVKNPSEIFLSQRESGLTGSVVVPCLEGKRPILVEIQALVSYSGLAIPRRRATGIDVNRILILMAVLERRAGMRLQNKDVFINVVGGVKVAEPAADLGIVTAVASNVKNVPVAPETVVLGEVGLGGEIRAVRQMEQRLKEAAKLGFKRAIIPGHNADEIKGIKGMDIIPVRRIREALSMALEQG